MRESASLLLLLFLVLSGASGVTAEQSFEELASFKTATLHGGENLSIESLSKIGVILLALNDCTITVDGSSVDLKAGERRFVHGSKTVNVSHTGAQSAYLLIVNVRKARQAQTFDQVELGPGQAMEDASSRNATLLVALNPVRLRDIIDHSDEGEPPRYGEARLVELGTGKTAWLLPGMHQITNIGGSIAKFVTIEW